MNPYDLCYAYFGWIGRGLSYVFRGVEHDLDAANMKVPPEVYFSFVGFVAILSLSGSILVFMLRFTGLMRLSFLPINDAGFISLLVATPFIVTVIGGFFPKMMASSRISGLKIEVPYASMYINIMTNGGLSPYESLLRMRNMDLLPNMKEEVNRIQTIVLSQGVDPLTAMGQAAKVVNMNDYKELLLGYVSTVRTGGDTLHYLHNQTENMFKRLSTRIKALGENMGVLMEIYTIIAILGVLGLFMVFVVSMAMPGQGFDISPKHFFLFSFVFLPGLSILFIYLGDAAQITYPFSNWKTYIMFAAFSPLGLFFGSQTVLPFFGFQTLIFPPIQDMLCTLRDGLGFAEGTEIALGLAITLILIAIPGVIADKYYIGREGNILLGINSFLRDLVETRKSGLSPERCIDALSSRDYGGFSKHLMRINLKLRWGYPMRQIYEEFRENVKNWLSLVNIYLLIDTIDVGGGTEESLETLAQFAESTKQLEDEKKAVLMPLTIVPYIGAALLTGTTVMFLQFLTGMSGLGVSIPHVTLYRVLLTPLALHSWVLGLVTGKITSGRVSAGFKHAILLALVSVGGVWIVSNLSMGSSMGAP